MSDIEHNMLRPSRVSARQHEGERREPTRAPRAALFATCVIGGAIMMLQIAVTRMLSVTAGYHSAFAVIALVMLGLAAASTSVFLRWHGPTPAT